MKKLLVANRGEIARRIFRSAKLRGIATVAVYSVADAESAHVEDADEAILVGAAPARDSYLDAAKVLDAARQTGADAIHPGYGFLSENADFAEQVIAAGLTWIGPSPDTLRSMGDKARARAIAKEAGVPVVPGSPRVAPDDDVDLLVEAQIIGFPLLVKASAGGGGIGMRRINSPETLLRTVADTQSMALKAFGDGTVFLERFVPKARHVEIQIFGFGNGDAIHLFERDCSLQRRFQKVIEESPAPELTKELRAKMADAAVALCRKVHYSGAGTVEFILDTETLEFFFLEMNTRIQVEHPVSEMVTGRDLVGMQIDFARGTLQGLAQSEVTCQGHAIECRLYAENPAKMFMPSPGTLTVFALPEETNTLRVDAGYRQGDTVTPYYDPMLAKIIAHGPDRATAAQRAADALRTLQIEGLASNKDFLIACLENAEFLSGDIHTGFIEDNRKVLLTALTKQWSDQ